MTGIDRPGDDGDAGSGGRWPRVPTRIDGPDGSDENGLGPDYEAHGDAPEGSETTRSSMRRSSTPPT